MNLNNIFNKSTPDGFFRFRITKLFSVKVGVLFSTIKCYDHHSKQTIANKTKQFKVITFSAISVYKTFKLLKYLINHCPTPKTFTCADLYYLM